WTWGGLYTSASNRATPNSDRSTHRRNLDDTIRSGSENTMKICVWLLILSLIALPILNDHARSYAAAIQQQPPRQPAPGKKFVQTPFGMDEVDLSDPRPAIAVGPP